MHRPRHLGNAGACLLLIDLAKRPNREREKMVGDRTRIINRMNAALARLGISGFNPTLRKAEESSLQASQEPAMPGYGAG